MGWITLAIQSLEKRVAARLKIICCFDRSSSHLSLLCNKTMPSDAESCEEQGGSKQNFVGGTTAKLWPVFHLDAAKNGKEKNNGFKPC